MRIHFTKMHGAGNDFVVIDGRTDPIELSTEQARHLADRRHGVGCDQIMLMTPAPDSQTHFGYRIFNADGGQVQQCGNGARAVALLAHQRGAGDQLLMHSPAGPVRARVSAGQVAVNMGPARFDPADIPLRANAQHSTYPLEDLRFGAVSLGNPHAVFTVTDVQAEPVEDIAQRLRSSQLFPEGVNVGFMQIRSRAEIVLRVIERGVGETLACGTGACAAVAVGAQRGELDALVQVSLPGGQLMVDCSAIDKAIWLTGPAHVAFEGYIDL